MGKTLIAFFSRADENYFGGSIRYIEVGNTEVAAEKIKELLDADVFKIEMKKPYAKEYMVCIEEAKADLQKKSRPELIHMPDSIRQYDTIILAYPNYWGTMPMAVFTFLEKFDFSGKTILPLCTNEGIGMGSSEKDIRNTCHGAAVTRGLPVSGSSVADAKPQIEKWLKVNNLI